MCLLRLPGRITLWLLGALFPAALFTQEELDQLIKDVARATEP